MNDASSGLKAFKRATSLDLSKWYMGILLTNLAEERDTNGAFTLLEATLGACRKEVRADVQGIGFIDRDGEFVG